ncbi:MAG TPA: metal ABC transporter permease [Firmicutes bacterium]|nr:metal ABC transporter permease [Bacillota bacterium]
MGLEWVTEPFQYGFMVRAFLGTSLIAVLAAMIGVFIVLKGLAFIGDAIAHVSFAGIALALLLGWPLHLGAFLLASVTAIGITLLNRAAKVRHDTALAILFTGAFAAGVIIMARMPSFGGDLSALLLGSVLGIRSQELWLIGGAVVVLGFMLWLAYHHLVYVAFDPVGAEAAGLPVLGLNILLMLMLSTAVVVSIQSVGVILVMALLITPAAAAGIFTRNLVKMMILAGALGIAATWVGLYLAFYYSLPPGATIVIMTTVEFAAALGVREVKRKLAASLRTPA